VRNHGRGTPAQIQPLGAASFSLNLNIYVVSIKRTGVKSRSQLLVIENLERKIACTGSRMFSLVAASFNLAGEQR
jgi:hypothetical protein